MPAHQGLLPSLLRGAPASGVRHASRSMSGKKMKCDPPSKIGAGVDGEPLFESRTGRKTGFQDDPIYALEFNRPGCGPVPHDREPRRSRVGRRPRGSSGHGGTGTTGLCCPPYDERGEGGSIRSKRRPALGRQAGACRTCSTSISRRAITATTRARSFPRRIRIAAAKASRLPSWSARSGSSIRFRGASSGASRRTSRPINPWSIWMLAFYFSSGYLDTYIDDVGFYRRRSVRR